MESAETRFAHLLQPIRDLTQNWDIDLASQLAGYLEELDQMCISFDGGKTMLNFAEAALLIQGTTCIYGKKVELLHNLVFQTLDYISDKNKKKEKNAAAVEGGEQNTAGQNNDDGFEFDSYDDTDTRSDLVEIKTDPNRAVEISRIPPEALIPPESVEKQEYPLISQQGEVLGSCKDFRMNIFTMDGHGVIRLGLGSARSRFLWGLSNETRGPLASVEMPALSGALSWLTSFGAEIIVPMGGDDVREGDAFMPLEDNDIDMTAEPEKIIRMQQSPSQRPVLRERPALQQIAVEQKQKEYLDPWKWHDPYAPVGEDKPLKTGKCYNVPPGLEESGKRKRKGSSKLEDFSTWCTNAYKTFDRKLKNGPLYPELTYIYLSKMKELLKVRRTFLKKMGTHVSEEELKKTFLELEENQEEPDAPELLRGHGAEGDYLFDDNPADVLDDSVPENIPEVPSLGLSDCHMGKLSYEDLVKQSVEQFLMNSERYARETALSLRVQEWEDKIKPHLVAEEERLAFDIRDYQDQIVQSFSTVKEKRLFASIVQGKDNHEVCRYMLATLQLANDYTVEIGKSDSMEESLDTMNLTLISKHRAHERLHTYSAPSTSD
ncbi:condensin-2 complex subunit H2 isoform X2 [Denticeps clupeoides]|uniref:condensin-2 complex subunit H2 isoform X2 n=1 Tax=Denticeps clupeoides TaxID=299321 RepID=UPI0010A3DA47|nr:condensin-2 complex subunit H2 isoform X2 [Denticeps clupeoides]XP_028810844.1 condensin-2 complex subunit H2 isoform X2 [Denticeps clupeoides]XP_028810845.1 condensin-2 complex subunit H2 isoform X2 [Denticeps clupeoides]